MKGQFNLILALVFTLVIATFSVVNVDSVGVNFLVMKTELPLIILIIGSALAGGVIIGSVGLFRQYKLQREIKLLRQTVGEQLGEAVLLTIDQQLKGAKLETKPTEQDRQIEEELAKAQAEEEPSVARDDNRQQGGAVREADKQ